MSPSEHPKGAEIVVESMRDEKTPHNDVPDPDEGDLDDLDGGLEIS